MFLEIQKIRFKSTCRNFRSKDEIKIVDVSMTCVILRYKSYADTIYFDFFGTPPLLSEFSRADVKLLVRFIMNGTCEQ